LKQYHCCLRLQSASSSNSLRTADLQSAISICQRLLHRNLPIRHPKRLEILNNLACFLPTRFGQTGYVRDLDEAISLHRQALTFLPVLHPDRPGSLYNLANVLGTRFIETGVIADVNEAISLHREALALIPYPHLERPQSLNNLAADLQS